MWIAYSSLNLATYVAIHVAIHLRYTIIFPGKMKSFIKLFIALFPPTKNSGHFFNKKIKENYIIDVNT